MTVLGTLLRNRRPKESNYAWNQTNLSAPDTLDVTSDDFTDASPLPTLHWGARVGGKNTSPHLAWSHVPSETVELLLLVEDIDAPLGANPAVHCLAVIDVSRLHTPNQLPQSALAKKDPAPGVTLLRSVISRGYYGPEPLKGHGPHRYVFQIYALGDSLLNRADPDALLKTRPRAVLTSIDVPVLARGRITAVSER